MHMIQDHLIAQGVPERCIHYLDLEDTRSHAMLEEGPRARRKGTPMKLCVSPAVQVACGRHVQPGGQPSFQYVDAEGTAHSSYFRIGMLVLLRLDPPFRRLC
jgi:hypothetical protein